MPRILALRVAGGAGGERVLLSAPVSSLSAVKDQLDTTGNDVVACSFACAQDDTQLALGRGRLRRSLVEFPRGALAHRAATGWLLSRWAAATLPLPLSLPLRRVVARGGGVAVVLTISGLPVARGELDLELIELVPLFISALAVWNRQQFLQSAAGRNGLRWRIHPRIIPLFGNGCFRGSRARWRASALTRSRQAVP